MPEAVDVSEERLRQLLDDGYEWEELDYKRLLDLSSRRDEVELAKDIGAMQVDGGHIVIGADDHGEPTGGLTDAHVQNLDEARVRGKMRRYLPEPIPMRIAHHVIDENHLVVIRVDANPEGLAIFRADGTHRRPGDDEDTFVFRRGDVYVRHGSASERWEQRDWERILERRDRERKEEWRREFAADLQAISGGLPSDAIAPIEVSWQLDDESFEAQVSRLLRTSDNVGLRELIDSLRRTAFDLTAADSRSEDVDTLLDRAICLGALLLSPEHDALFDDWLRMMADLYGRGFDTNGLPRNLWRTDTAVFWLDIIERIIALGALAVRRRNWPAVRRLATCQPPGYDFREGHYNNWIRHALTMAARSHLFRRTEQEREVEVSLLVLSQRVVDRLACLRPDLPAGEEAVLNSLCQFDLLAALAAIDVGGVRSRAAFYPNFARFYSSRTEPAAEVLIEDGDARTALFHGDDEALASAFRTVDEAAHDEGFRYVGWDGFESSAVRSFLDRHPEQ